MYKYFFQVLKEEPIEIRRYSLYLILIPLLFICILNDWQQDLILFLVVGYVNFVVGFLIVKYSDGIPKPSLKKKVYQKMLDEQLEDLVVFRNNHTQQIAYANAAFSQKLGLGSKVVEGMWFSDFVSRVDMKLFRRRKTKKLSIQPYSMKDKVIRLKKSSGEIIWVEIDSKPINKKLTMFTFKEVTKRVQQQKANRQLAIELLAKRNRTLVFEHIS